MNRLDQPVPKDRLAHRIVIGQFVLFGCIVIGALALGLQNTEIKDEQNRLKAQQAQIRVNQAQIKTLTNQNCRNIANLAAIQRAFVVRQEIQLNALLGSNITGVPAKLVARFRLANRKAENILLSSFDALARENCKPEQTARLPAVVYLRKGATTIAALRPLAETTPVSAPLQTPLILPRGRAALIPLAPIVPSPQPVSFIGAPAPRTRGSPPLHTVVVPPAVQAPPRPVTPAPAPPPSKGAPPPPPKEQPPPPKERPKPPKEEPPPKERPKPPKEEPPPPKERPGKGKGPPHTPPGLEKHGGVPPGHECHGNGAKRCP